MLEYEKKALLSKDEYAVLVDRCEGMAVKPQINYYFDTEDLYMNRKGITCRVRAKEGKYKATIKNHIADGLNCSVEEDLYEDTEFNYAVFEALGMYLQGSLITTRLLLHKDACCEIVLDWNVYLGYEDFEIEAEYAKGCENSAIDHLKSIAESLVAADLVDSVDDFMLRIGKGKSKSERFFERKRTERGK